MSKAVFAICDSESMYIYNLMEYVHSRKGEEFEVQAFTGVESLCACAKEKTIEILLISGKLLCEQVRELQIRKVMVLSEGEQICELSEYSAVYKYQPADSLIAEVMDSYARVKEAPAAALFKPEVEVIGIYSPVKRTGKTSFALTLGQLLAGTKAVLYLNLEEYAGFDALMNRQFEGDISDLMYFAGSGKGNLISKLGGLVQTINNLDYIPPAFSPFDLRSIKYSEWLGLIEDLCSYSSYEVILLDLGEQVDNLPELLNRCGKIYMPVREDSMAVTKIAQYEKVMIAREYEEVLGKTIKIKLPFHSSFGKKEHYVEQLIWSELGDPLDQIKKIKSMGILSLVLKDDTQVSDKTIKRKNLPSERTLQQGSLLVNETSANAVSEAVFLNYLRKHFLYATDKEENHAKGSKEHSLSYELEYIIGGQKSDRENLKKTVNRILLIREGMNYVCLEKSAKMRGEAMALAAAITGAAALPEFAGAMQKLLMLAWAYGESLLDVRTLLAKGKVPMMKTEAQWKLPLEKLGVLTEVLKECDAGGGSGQSYEDYLAGILAAGNKRQRNLRVLDLIECNRRMEKGGETFRADALVAQAKASADFELAPVFLRVPAMWMHVRNQGTSYTVNGQYGYEQP